MTAPANLPSVTVVVPEGWMLYIPFLWFHRSVDHCRTAALEVSMDVRGILHQPFAERFIANERG